MWMKISLSQDQLASGELEHIHDHFVWMFLSAGGPADVAMFGQSRSDYLLTADGAGRLLRKPSLFDEASAYNRAKAGEYQTLYFSPAAAKLAGVLMVRYGGMPCNRPPKRCALLVGQDRGAAQLLRGSFPL
jgi:hypothetical protein